MRKERSLFRRIDRLFVDCGQNLRKVAKNIFKAYVVICILYSLWIFMMCLTSSNIDGFRMFFITLLYEFLLLLGVGISCLLIYAFGHLVLTVDRINQHENQMIAMLGGGYSCSQCGAIMEFEDERRDNLICPKCGYKVDIHDYGFESDEEYDNIIPKTEYHLWYDESDD